MSGGCLGRVFLLPFPLAFPLAFLLLAAAAPCRADDAPVIEIIAYGEYAPSADYGPLAAQYRQETLGDVQMTDVPPLVSETDRIEARPCTRFGLTYRIIGAAADGVLTVQVDHPPLHDPEGGDASTERFQTPAAPGLHYTGFEFDEAWEMVPGAWTFSLLSGSQVLATQRFDVSLADGVPAGCHQPVS